MSDKTVAAYGTWPSPISAERVAAGSKSLSYPKLAGDTCYWLEGRAAESGRTTLMRQQAGNDTAQEVTPNPINVRSAVHEYGGGAYQVLGQQVVFSDVRDHQLYLQDGAAAAQRLSNGNRKLRYADIEFDPQRQRVLAVVEDHSDSDLQPRNSLCALALDGSNGSNGSSSDNSNDNDSGSGPTLLASGHDFYAAPRLSPDGSQLAWLSWDHPRMPWQGTELWLANLAPDGSLQDVHKVAGSEHEAICLPQWSPDGVLYFVSDMSGWWNLYRHQHGDNTCIHQRAAEFGEPHWQFGGAMYGFAGKDEIICSFIENGLHQLARLDLRQQPATLALIDTIYTEIHDPQVSQGQVLMLAGSARRASEVVLLDLQSGQSTVLATSIAELPPASCLSQPQPVSYTSNGRTAHALYYPPCNESVSAPQGTLPPLMVIGHGGPTGLAGSSLRLAIQYWTSRGFALLDVNYGGSSGYGRAYRDALQGQWGVVDVEDCVNGARFLVAQNKVDPAQLVIRGGSAGGFTTLCALMFHDVFKAGASYFGVSDLAGLDADSHKFESHYNHYLIAPPPESHELYRQRSPSNHTDKLRHPVIFFQGLEDKVVPPPQSEQMVNALRARGVPVAYLTFEGEGHGFRRGENIRRTLEAELYFYQRVLGMDIDTTLAAAVEIENL